MARPSTAPRYRGRFAPSPTGPLHMGSLVAATASYLEAQANSGDWLLRIENIDPPREVAGAADSIIASLDAHGFEWSGPIRYQSDRTTAHEAAAQELLAAGLAYPCDCSRRDMRATAKPGPVGPLYPGTCRRKAKEALGPDTALRIRTTPALIAFTDELQGPQRCRIDQEVGDFVIRRRDGLIAYVLAGTLDDHAQGISHVVRGVDLLPVTPAQHWLQRLLGLDRPEYAHVPMVMNDEGQKLSKQTGAAPLDSRQTGMNLHQALVFLGQAPPNSLARESTDAIWAWARAHWPQSLAAKAAQSSFFIT
ncbi:MAG: tRNA glutamyl-Q(34) synthetase GluQRS [Gammaproteobacteria bacterium]